MQYAAALIHGGVPPATAKRFLDWHNRHPEVWKEFEALALEAIAEGVRRWGAKGIFEVMRWKAMKAKKPRRLRHFNNNYPTYYARVFVTKYPQHRTFFKFSKVRGLKSRHTDFY